MGCRLDMSQQAAQIVSPRHSQGRLPSSLAREHPGPNTQRQCPRLDNSPAAVGDMPSPPTALLSDHPEQHSPPRTQRRERACKFAGRGKTGIAHLPFTDSVVRSAKSEWWSESCVSAAPHVPRHLGTHTCRINPLSAPHRFQSPTGGGSWPGVHSTRELGMGSVPPGRIPVFSLFSFRGGVAVMLPHCRAAVRPLPGMRGAPACSLGRRGAARGRPIGTPRPLAPPDDALSRPARRG